MRSFQPRLSEEQMRRRAVFLAAFQGLGSSQTCMCALIAPPAMFQFPLRQICPLNANVNGDDTKAGKSSTELQRSESEGTLSKPRRAQRCLINSASHPLSTYLSTHTSPHPLAHLSPLPSASATGQGDVGCPSEDPKLHRHSAALGWFIYPPCGGYLWSYRTLASPL